MKKTLKLNLGCGRDHRVGWVNADIDQRVNPDLVVDIQADLPFIDQSADSILLQDILEHLTKEQAQIFLTECHRVLKDKGVLSVRIPNVFQIVQQFAKDPEVALEFIYGTTEFSGVWGSHKAGYTQNSITNVLKRAGFTNIVVSQETTNFHIVAQKTTKTHQPKVLIIQQSPDWGGAEEWISQLSASLADMGCKTTLVTNLEKLRESVKGSPHIATKKLPYVLDIIGNTKGLIKTCFFLLPSILFYLKLLYSAKKSGHNIILMSGFSEKLLVTWLSQLFSIPIVWYEYGPLDTVFKRNLYLPKVLYRLSNHLPSRVITISNSTKQNLITSARVSLAKLRLFPPGTIIPGTHTNSKKKTLTIGSLSRLTPEKGQRKLIKAFKLVSKEIPEVELILAGKGPDEEFLKKMVHDHNLAQKVIFQGFVNDKADFYSKIDVFVFPSEWEMEGFGVVNIEAMSFGVPVIGFDNGPFSEIIDNSCGSVVSERSPEQLAEAILFLLKSPEIRLDKGKKARKRAKKEYNINTQAQKVYQLLHHVVQEHT